MVIDNKGWDVLTPGRLRGQDHQGEMCDTPSREHITVETVVK